MDYPDTGELDPRLCFIDRVECFIELSANKQESMVWEKCPIWHSAKGRQCLIMKGTASILLKTFMFSLFLNAFSVSRTLTREGSSSHYAPRELPRFKAMQ